MKYLSVLSIVGASPALLCEPVSEREQGLTIALVIFIMISVLLTAFVVLLFVSKKFRALFFKQDEKKDDAPVKPKKQTQKQASEPAPQQDGQKQTARAPRRKQSTVFDEVPTVPLGGFTAQAKGDDVLRRTDEAYMTMNIGGDKKARRTPPPPRTNDTLDKIPTIVIPQATVDNVRKTQAEKEKTARKPMTEAASAKDKKKKA